MLRSHAEFLADVYGMQSTNDRALTIDAVDAIAAWQLTQGDTELSLPLRRLGEVPNRCGCSCHLRSSRV